VHALVVSQMLEPGNTPQTGGQWYSDTSPFSIPCSNPWPRQNLLFSGLRVRWSSRAFAFGIHGSPSRWSVLATML